MVKTGEFNKVQNNVIKILSTFPHTRDCDKCLIFYYWQTIDKINIIQITPEKVHNLTTSETITRCRRKIQNEMLQYLPLTEAVKNARKTKERLVREWAQNE